MALVESTSTNNVGTVPGQSDEEGSSTVRSPLSQDVQSTSPDATQAAADKLLGVDRMDLASRTWKDTPDAKDRRDGTKRLIKTVA
jgi:hypothetical protein